MNDIMLINDAIKKHRELWEYYDAMGCKDDVLVQERYIGWLSELREYKANNAELVKHRHWIEKNDWIACSNCNHEILDDYYEKRYKYIACPYCGAKMDGVQNEHCL